MHQKHKEKRSYVDIWAITLFKQRGFVGHSFHVRDAVSKKSKLCQGPSQHENAGPPPQVQRDRQVLYLLCRGDSEGSSRIEAVHAFVDL